MPESAAGTTGGVSERPALAWPPFRLATIVTVSVVGTPVTLAVNPMEVVPEMTVTDAGTFTLALLSARLTDVFTGAGLTRLTVQLELPAALNEVGLQDKELRAAAGAFKLICAVRWTP